MGRFTLPEWLGLPLGRDRPPRGRDGARPLLGRRPGAAGLRPEAAVGRGEEGPRARGPRLRRHAGGGGLRPGDPRTADAEAKFARMGPELQRSVEERAIFVDPAEVVDLRKDIGVQVAIVDLRDERDFNLFHIGGSRRATLAGTGDAGAAEDPPRPAAHHRHLPGRQRRGGSAHRLEAPHRAGRAEPLRRRGGHEPLAGALPGRRLRRRAGGQSGRPRRAGLAIPLRDREPPSRPPGRS